MNALTPVAPMMVAILETRLIQKGALVASLKISIGKLILHDVSILCANEKAWAAPPSKPQIGRDGVVVKDQNGKTRYVPVVEFADGEARARFSAGVVAAFEANHGPIAVLAARGAR